MTKKKPNKRAHPQAASSEVAAVNRICQLVESRRGLTAQIRGLELPLREDARERFAKKPSLKRVAYRVIRQGRNEVLEFAELKQYEELAPSEKRVISVLIYRATRKKAKLNKARIGIVRSVCFTEKPIPKIVG